MNRVLKNVVPLIVFAAVAIAAYALWPKLAPLLIFSCFILVAPVYNLLTRPDIGWGIILRRRRDRIAYGIAICIALLAIWSLALGWLPPIVVIPIAAAAFAGWGLFVVASIGPEGMQKFILRDKAQK
jgi:hypothetical protein